MSEPRLVMSWFWKSAGLGFVRIGFKEAPYGTIELEEEYGLPKEYLGKSGLISPPTLDSGLVDIPKFDVNLSENIPSVFPSSKRLYLLSRYPSV